FALFVAFKLCDIQLAEGDKYKELAEARTERMFTIPANRGNLYAGDGSLLATSVPKYDIRFDALAPKQTDFEENIQGLSKGLAEQLGKPQSYYIDLLRKARVNKNRYCYWRVIWGIQNISRLKNCRYLIKVLIKEELSPNNVPYVSIH
ncbi:MAG: hypothetical protein VX226_05875, partial [Bacteroidota bacterium]|nr:hypothetical protein [Bacteroidota bacterium]